MVMGRELSLEKVSEQMCMGSFSMVLFSIDMEQMVKA